MRGGRGHTVMDGTDNATLSFYMITSGFKNNNMAADKMLMLAFIMGSTKTSGHVHVLYTVCYLYTFNLQWIQFTDDSGNTLLQKIK